jgi:multidrug efflux pump subunit AcrB
MKITVNNIERIEATADNGVGLIRVYKQQGTIVDLAVAQITAVSQTLFRTLPPGIFKPLIAQTDASSVSRLQLGLSNDTLTERHRAGSWLDWRRNCSCVGKLNRGCAGPILRRK